MSRTENSVSQLNAAYKEFTAGAIDRRQFMARASALGISAATVGILVNAGAAGAQDATPVASGEIIKSMTAAEYKAALMEWWTTFEAPAATGGTVIYGELASSNLTTTNLMLSADIPTSPIFNLVNETLVGTSAIDGQYVPNLADRWEISDGGLTYTFFLRQGVTWHDGTPFTADDVIFSWESQSNPAIGSSYTGQFTETVAGWEKVDDSTVRLLAKDVFAEIVFHGFTYCPIMAKHIWEGVAAEAWATDGGSNGTDPSRVVGTGPFKFQEINEGEGTATFVPNPTYYDADAIPQFDTWIFSTWPDSVAVVEALRSGTIDFYDAVPPDDVESIINPEGGTDMNLYETYTFGFYGTNMDPAVTTLFQDVQVRQAMMYAIDRQSIITNIYNDLNVLAIGTQPTLSPAFQPERINTIYTYDPEKAKALLAEAGWVDSDGDGIVEKDGVKLSFDFEYGSGDAPSDATAAVMQEQWKAVGIDGVPTPIDFGAVLIPKLTETFDFRVIMVAFSWDPTGDQSAMFHTDNYGPGSFNFVRYSNPAADALFDASAREVDSAARLELLVEVGNIINDDIPVAVLWFRKERVGYQTRLKNFAPNGNGGLIWSLPYVWVQE